MRSNEFLKNYNIVDGELVELDKTLSKAQKPKVVSLSEYLRQFTVGEGNELADSQPCFLLTDCFAGASLNEDGGSSYSSLPEPTLQGPTGKVLVVPIVPLDQCPAELENQCPVSMEGEECEAKHKFKIRWGESGGKRDWDAGADEAEYVSRLVRTRTYLATDKSGGGQLYQGCRRRTDILLTSSQKRSGRKMHGQGRTSRKIKGEGGKVARKNSKRGNQPWIWKGGKNMTGRKRGATKSQRRGQRMNFVKKEWKTVKNQNDEMEPWRRPTRKKATKNSKRNGKKGSQKRKEMDRKKDRNQNEGRLVAKKGNAMGERKKEECLVQVEEHQIKEGFLETQEKCKRKTEWQAEEKESR